jgi:RecB family exonuclease
LNANLENNGKGISAGKLNRFLTCPLSFYYQEIARLHPVDAVMEDDDPVETGELLHKVFHAYYSPKLGGILNRREQSHTELINCFRQVMRQSSIPDTFPQDALVWLRQKAPVQLRKYLDEQPEQTRVIALEAEAEARITVGGSQFKLAGRLDRIDERAITNNEIIFTDCLNAGERESGEEGRLTGLIILDYKTGKVSPPQADFWSDAGLWKNIREALAQPGQSRPGLLSDIADGLNNNIQLPLYLFLLRHGQLKAQQHNTGGDIARQGDIYNAAWVELRDSGKEYPLLPETLSQNERTEILERKIPELLAFILSGIKNSRAFEARRNGHCAYCPYAELCLIG